MQQIGHLNSGRSFFITEFRGRWHRSVTTQHIENGNFTAEVDPASFL